LAEVIARGTRAAWAYTQSGPGLAEGHAEQTKAIAKGHAQLVGRAGERPRRSHSRSREAVAQETASRTLEDSSLQGKLQEAFGEALTSLGPLPGPVSPQVSVADPRFGDYQCNNAMVLFKLAKQNPGTLGDWRSPKDAGEALKAALPSEMDAVLESVSVAPQGFVTMKLRLSWIEEEVRKLYLEGLQLRTSKPQRIVMDFSSPNIAKEMHVGHLRSTILGDSIANLLKWLGHDVVRLNHVGDWGTQFGMLLEYMQREGSLSELEGESVVKDLQTFYRNAKLKFDEDADFRKAAQAKVVSLQAGEAWESSAWRQICEVSRSEFEVIYQRLGIRGLEERGESFYNEMLAETVQELDDLGLTEEDGGAMCIFTNVSKAPLIVRKADGGYGYDSTDCAAVRHRLREEKADRIIYVIDNGQETHMRMVFEVAERAAWLPTGARLDFVGFGLVQGEDGKKFKTRSGDVVRLRDLLDEATARAAAELRKRAKDRNKGKELTEADLERIETGILKDAEQIGTAAVKYFDMRNNRNSDYRFSYDAMLDPKGNTAVYVLYAYARLAAVLRRSGRDVMTLEPSSLALAEPAERDLGRRLLQLPEVLALVEDDLFPNRLVDYIYDLASDFTTFYMECPIVGSDAEESRLMLCEVTRRTLQVTLEILGINPLDRL